MPEKGLFCGKNNRPRDPQNMTDLEKKHTAVIECPDTVRAGEPFNVHVRIGETSHPSEEGHHIQWIALYSGDNLLARAEITPGFARPEATFTLVKGGKHRTSTLKVIERCNLHGQWEAEKEITITE